PSTWIWNNYGEVLLERNQIQEAEEAFRHAVELETNSGDAHANLGLALIFQKKTSEGILELEKAAVLLPNNPKVHINLGTAYAAVGNQAGVLREVDVLEKLRSPFAEDLKKRIRK